MTFFFGSGTFVLSSHQHQQYDNTLFLGISRGSLAEPVHDLGAHLAPASAPMTFAQRAITAVAIVRQPAKQGPAGNLQDMRHDRDRLARPYGA
jgi:hypothetical protein